MPERKPLPTAADARKVWETAEKPSDRAVADKLNASGKYAIVTESTINRWRKSGWKEPTHTGGRARGKAALDKVLPGMTGKATTNSDTLVDDLKDKVIPDYDVTKREAELEKLTDEQRADALQKAHEITQVIAAEVARRMFSEMPQLMAAYVKAGASAYVDTLRGHALRVQNIPVGLLPAPADPMSERPAISPFARVLKLIDATVVEDRPG